MTDDPENPEVFIRGDEVWIPDGKALCEKIGAAYLYFVDGELWGCIPGRGDDLVRDLLSEKPVPNKPALASVSPIK